MIVKLNEINSNKRVRLTPTQAKVYIASVSSPDGLKQVCETVNLDIRAFKSHLGNLYKKLKCRNRLHMIIKHYRKDIEVVNDEQCKPKPTKNNSNWRYKK